MASASCSAAATPPKNTTTTTWVTKSSKNELENAKKLGVDSPAHRLGEDNVRIETNNTEVGPQAVWLIKGRPGYIVTREDSDGKKEDWKEPFCLVCDCYATDDHVASVKHMARVEQAEYWLDWKGYGEVLAWLRNNDTEVIHLTGPVEQDPPGGVLRLDDGGGLRVGHGRQCSTVGGRWCASGDNARVGPDGGR